MTPIWKVGFGSVGVRIGGAFGSARVWHEVNEQRPLEAVLCWLIA